ncbi:MAG: hypothetical protein J6W52_04555 [Bacteroidaceae bacterium]|nr:hypothetical protein [Bacteroidaceae bacterium]
MKKISVILLLWAAGIPVLAQTSLDGPDRGETTMISPYYFGPNAFAVPDMLDGTVQHDMRIELDGNHFFGTRGDHTTDLTLKVNIPLFSDRVNLTAWMPIAEWYRNSDESLAVSRLTEKALTDPKARKGCVSGDVYITTDIHLIRQKRYVPDIALRAALRTASGNDYQYARNYDSPGYFFDATVAKSFVLGARKEHDLRVALSGGFLCWQTNNARQNDAFMFGLMLKWTYKRLMLEETLRGYSGWEHSSTRDKELAHDRPVVLKTRVAYKIKKWEVLASYQYGMRDYPFHQMQLGLAYHIDILKK